MRRNISTPFNLEEIISFLTELHGFIICIQNVPDDDDEGTHLLHTPWELTMKRVI